MAIFSDNSDRTFQTGDKLVGFSGGQDYSFPFTTILTNFDTDDLDEGSTNLYFTQERSDDAVNTLLVAGTGITKSYNDGANTLTIGIIDPPNVEEQNIRMIAVMTGVIDHTAILDLHDTPVDITSVAPQTGLIAGIYVALFFDNIGTTAYTNSGIQVIDATSGVILADIPSAFLNSSSSRPISVGIANEPSGTTALASKLQLKAVSGDPTGGNAANQIKFECGYRIIDFQNIA
jgi:hypothetical protein